MSLSNAVLFVGGRYESSFRVQHIFIVTGLSTEWHNKCQWARIIQFVCIFVLEIALHILDNVLKIYGFVSVLQGALIEYIIWPHITFLLIILLENRIIRSPFGRDPEQHSSERNHIYTMDINETSMLFHSWLLQPMTLIIFILVQINYLMQGVKDVWLPP